MEITKKEVRDEKGRLVKVSTLKENEKDTVQIFEYNDKGLRTKEIFKVKNKYNDDDCTVIETETRYNDKDLPIKELYRCTDIYEDKYGNKMTSKNHRITYLYYNGGHDKYGRETYIVYSNYGHYSMYRKLYNVINPVTGKLEYYILRERTVYGRNNKTSSWTKRKFNENNKILYIKNKIIK